MKNSTPTKQVLAGALALACILMSYASEADVVYRTNRVFQATDSTIGEARVFNIANGVTNLTGIIVAGSPIITNSHSATEREGVSWGQPSATQAWHNITNGGPLTIGTYTNIFDDPGWIKGVTSVTMGSNTSHGAYMWYLQNSLSFTTPGSTYYTNSGKTYLLDKVLVGTLGDYAPGTSYTETFPKMNDPAASNYPGCTFLTSEVPAGSETVKYGFNTTSYYRLGWVQAQPDGEVNFTGSTENVRFELVDGSLTNVSWQISPDLGTNGALFADSPTGPGKTWGTNGTAVWVAAGPTARNYVIKAQLNDNLAVNDRIGLVVTHRPSYTPCGDKIYVWESTPYEEIVDGVKVFDNAGVHDLASLYQGWSLSSNDPPVTWFRDSSSNDNDCGTCTIENLKSMASGGVVFFLGHGKHMAGSGWLELVRFAEKASAEAWVGTNTNNIVVLPNADTNCWVVLASSGWFDEHWKASLDANKAIVFLYACSSADEPRSIASSVGGRTVFASEGPVSGLAVGDLYVETIAFMNGTHELREPWLRSAANALTAAKSSLGGIFDSAVMIAKGGDSTLCPVPLTVYPQSADEAETGWGGIAFDTYMNGFAPPNAAVKPTVGEAGSRAWKSDGTGNFFVEFLYASRVSNIVMLAVSNQCRSQVSVYPGRPLDGDARAPMSTNGQSRTWGW